MKKIILPLILIVFALKGISQETDFPPYLITDSASIIRNFVIGSNYEYYVYSDTAALLFYEKSFSGLDTPSIWVKNLVTMKFF